MKQKIKRLGCLEARHLEAEVKRLSDYMRARSDEELQLVVDICDYANPRKFTDEEWAAFESHCAEMAGFSPRAHAEYIRRTRAEVLGLSQ